MELKGSCHCGAVKFRFQSQHFYPYQACYCSICRKTQGGGGYAINLSGDTNSLVIKGEHNITVYHAKIKNPEDKKAHTSSAERNFCSRCGSALWLYSPEWPDLFHPFASAIDTPLPVAPERTHIMLEFKSPWVEVKAGADDKKFQRYPHEAIADWHKRMGLTDETPGANLS